MGRGREIGKSWFERDGWYVKERRASVVLKWNREPGGMQQLCSILPGDSQRGEDTRRKTPGACAASNSEGHHTPTAEESN